MADICNFKFADLIRIFATLIDIVKPKMYFTASFYDGNIIYMIQVVRKW